MNVARLGGVPFLLVMFFKYIKKICSVQRPCSCLRSTTRSLGVKWLHGKEHFSRKVEPVWDLSGKKTNSTVLDGAQLEWQLQVLAFLLLRNVYDEWLYCCLNFHKTNTYCAGFILPFAYISLCFTQLLFLCGFRQEVLKFSSPAQFFNLSAIGKLCICCDNTG